MKFFIIILSVLLIIGLFLYLFGNSLPPTQELKTQIQIKAPIAKVWLIMTTWADQPQWRKNIREVKILTSSQFSEIPKRGKPIHFQVLEREEPKRIKLKMSGGVTGSYSAELLEESGITTVKITESITIQSAFQRILNKVFFNLEEFAKEYLTALKSYSENSF